MERNIENNSVIKDFIDLSINEVKEKIIDAKSFSEKVSIILGYLSSKLVKVILLLANILKSLLNNFFEINRLIFLCFSEKVKEKKYLLLPIIIFFAFCGLIWVVYKKVTSIYISDSLYLSFWFSIFIAYLVLLLCIITFIIKIKSLYCNLFDYLFTKQVLGIFINYILVPIFSLIVFIYLVLSIFAPIFQFVNIDISPNYIWSRYIYKK
jgi:hypothetical protein